MAQLFRRVYELQVDTIRLTHTGGLNIAFSVERTLRRRPGRSEIKIWNLSADHRAQLEALAEGSVFARLSAGYDDARGSGQIFDGRLHRATTERSGADLITTIKSRDGGHAVSTSRSSRSHARGVSVGSVVEGLVGDLGLGLGNLGSVLGSLSIGGVGSFAEGFVSSGSSAEELDGVLDSAGYEWSVQNGAVQVLPRGRGLTRPAVRLTPETGLIGRPIVDEHGRVTCSALLIPELVLPGQLVSIESPDRSGTYRVEKSKVAGEFDGSEWGVQITGGPPS